MSSKSRVSTSSIFQLKVTLKDTRPPIWRRILVDGNTSLQKLHDVLQLTMGWGNYHLHAFEIHGREYGVPDPEFEQDSRMRDEKSVKVMKVVAEKDRFLYVYDFGDDWQHQIVVEKILPREQGRHYPVCVAGAMACPPEDCGGTWGYREFLEAITDPDHEEHESMIEWVGGGFDPEEFNLDEINVELKQIK